MGKKTAMELPPGWEACWSEEYQRHYYQDHNTQTTTWEDPRVLPDVAPPACKEPAAEKVAAEKLAPWDMHDMRQATDGVDASASAIPHDEQPCAPWDKAALHQKDVNAARRAQKEQKEKPTFEDVEEKPQEKPRAGGPLDRVGKVWVPGLGWIEQPSAGMETGYEEFDPQDFDPPDVAEGETHITDDKIMRIKDGSMYVGQTDYHKRPHGHGHLMLPDSSQHVGYFEQGRANGAGMAQTPNGMVAEGEWRDNHRQGIFKVIDAKGIQWIEKYNVEGKKTARKKVKKSVPNPAYVEGGEAPATIEVPEDPVEPAAECWTCGGLFHRSVNNDYACRKHKGKWIIDRRYQGEASAPGVWNCCANTNQADRGCVFMQHKLDHGECIPKN